MQKLSDILPSSSPLSHANIIIGNPKTIVSELKNILAGRFGEEFIFQANPDFVLRHAAVWGIDESRELKAFQSRRAIKYPLKAFIIIPQTITIEAQNSLLKTLEEPAPDTCFFMTAKHLGMFLPTVVSRCQVFSIASDEGGNELEKMAGDFIRASVPERWEMAKVILKRSEDIQSYGLDFLNCLLAVYWGKISRPVDKKGQAGAEVLLSAASLAAVRGNSLRIILDHVSLVLPVI